MSTGIYDSTTKVLAEVFAGRVAAHQKHGDNSIEAIAGDDIARWLPILVEEHGEVGEALTYDKSTSKAEALTNLRAELLDVSTVCVAWIAALDRLES